MKHDLAGLRQARAKVTDDLGAISIGPNTSEEDLARAETLTAEGARLDRLIAAASTAQQLKASTAIPAQPIEQIAGYPASAPAQVAERPEPGIRFAQVTRALVYAKGRLDVAHQFASRTWGESHPVATEIGAALNSNDANSGGFLVPERYSAEIIDLLLPRTTIRRRTQLAGGVVPLVGGTDNMPTVESGINAYYIGENQDLTASEPTFGNLKMVEREIAALVPISNKLLRHASVSVDSMVRNLIVRGLAQAEDLNFLRGTGSGAGPRGLRFMTGIGASAANATVNVANIEADARTAELAMMQADIPMIAPCWIMAPRTMKYLADLRDGNGNYYYPSLQGANPTWRGFPVEWTNNVPINLGGGSNESEVYLVDFAYVMIGDSYQIRIDASDTASYKGTGGSLISAYSQNQTVIRALAGHDLGLSRAKAVYVLTAVRWF